MIPFILGALAAVGLSELSKRNKPKMADGGGVGKVTEVTKTAKENNGDKLDKEIFSVLLKIYKAEGNSGKDLFSFSQPKLHKLLSEKAFNRLKRGDSSLGKIQLYGGGLGQYYALNIANGDFYKRLNGKKYTNGGGFSEKAELKKREAGEFISLIFQSRDIAHKAHLKTDSFSAHKALNEYYDGILPLVDGLVESYQGMYGKIDIPEWKTDTKEIVPYLESVLKYIQEHKDKAFTDSSLLNQVDEIKAMVQGTLYKLKELN